MIHFPIPKLVKNISFPCIRFYVLLFPVPKFVVPGKYGFRVGPRKYGFITIVYICTYI